MPRAGLAYALLSLLVVSGCAEEPVSFRGMRTGMPVSEFRAAFPGAKEQEKGFSEGVHMVRYQIRPGNGVNFAECYFKDYRLTGAVLFFDGSARIESLIWEVSAVNGKPDIDHTARNSRVVRWGEAMSLFKFGESTVMQLPTGEKRHLTGIVMFLGA